MTLTHPEQMLLEAISAAVRDEHVPWTEKISTDDWWAFLQLAANHNILPMVYEAVYNCPAADAEPAIQHCKLQVIQLVTNQTVKTSGFLKLYDTLTAQGLHPLVVKGIVCRSMYPHGDYRTSSDEDILIPEAEWDACCQAMQEYGMTALGRGNDFRCHEIGWRKDLLYVELHRSLFPPENVAYGELNELFSDAHISASDYPVESGKSVRSLCPHDHLLYLILHACKHFIHSGFGIRQVCDIGLWAMCYRREIDWDKLYQQCQKAHALLFTAAIFRLSQTCLNISIDLPPAWSAVDIDPEPLLHDLLTGGVYGSSDRNRLHAATVTVNAVVSGRQHKNRSVLSSVFPSREQLLGQYPELAKHPGRLPVVWLKRIVKYSRELRNGENVSSAESLRIAKERTKLLELYGILQANHPRQFHH